jgi:hypothetical protein
VFRWGNLRERAYFDDLGIDGRIALKLTFKKWVDGPWTGLIWLWKGTGGRTLINAVICVLVP